MFAAESMELIKAAPGNAGAFNNWVWVMLDFNPSVIVKEFE